MKRTQWFKDGDHPAVLRPKEPHLQPVPGMKNCGVVYGPANPGGALVREGDWIVENDDGAIWIQRGETTDSTLSTADTTTEGDQNA